MSPEEQEESPSIPNLEKKPAQEQEFFMRISSPNILRKNLLEASKFTLTILRQTYTVKQYREVKQELLSNINKEMKELKLLLDKADHLLPQYTKAELKKLMPNQSLARKPQPQQQAQPAQASQPKKEEAPAVPEQASELDRIGKIMEEIQKKLQNL
jgi:hypothetical protein